MRRTKKRRTHLDETMSIGCQNLRIGIVEVRGTMMGFQSNKNGDLMGFNGIFWIYIYIYIIDLPSGKLSHSYGKSFHFQWVNPLFRLGHFQ